MRVSSSQVHDQSVASINRLSAATTETQQQIASGRRVLSAADDAAAAGRITRLDAELAQRDRYVENAGRAEELLVQEETILDQVADSLIRVRELTLQAGNGALSPADRTFLGTELAARSDELVALLNSRSADGNYLFSGLKDNGPPFTFDASGLQYSGDSGQREIAIGDGRRIAISDSGARVFQRVLSSEPTLAIRSADNLSADLQPAVTVADSEQLSSALGGRYRLQFDEAPGGLSMTLTDLASGLIVDGIEQQPYASSLAIPSLGAQVTLGETPAVGDTLLLEVAPRRDLLTNVALISDALAGEFTAINQSPEALQSTISTVLDGLGEALNQILDTQAGIGARLNSIDDARSLNEDLVLRGQETLSKLRDVDFASAVSDLNYQAFLLEAAQQSYVRISRLSLFNSL